MQSTCTSSLVLAGDPGSAGDRNGTSSQGADTAFLSGLLADQQHRIARFLKLLDEAVVRRLAGRGQQVAC